MYALRSVASLLILGAALSAQTPPRAPEVQKLEAFVGTWTTEGRAEASPLGPAKHWTGTLKGEWCPGGFAVIRYDDEQDESGHPDRAIFVFYYDTKTKSHRAFVVGTEGGGDAARVSFEQDAMTWMWEVPIEGKRYTLRGTLKPLSAAVREYEGAYSEDGKTWKVFEHSMDTRKK